MALVGLLLPISFRHHWFYLSVILSVVLNLFVFYCSFKGLKKENDNPGWFGRFYWIVIGVSVLLLSYAKLYEKHGLLNNGAVVHDFQVSLYFSVVTFTTLGYGDFQPTETIRLWAASEAILGYMVMAVLTAFIIKYLSRI